MSVNSLGISTSALHANQFRIDTAANNIANANTDGFQSRSVQSSDLGYINDIGQGTRVSATYQNPARGAPVQPPAEGAAAQSNTDMVTEMTGMQSASTAYRVNAAALGTADGMTRTLLDIRA